MSPPFEDRHVVVTGGTGALGSAVVGALVDQGATCWVPARTQSAASRFRLAEHDRVNLVLGVDLSDEKATQSFYGQLPSLWASIQVAGGFTMAPLTETPLRDYDAMFDVNMKTCFLCCREAVMRMRETSQRNGGRLVNVTARPAVVPTGGMAIYSASKAAVAAFSCALAEELAPEQIWVNAVVPSIIDTAANRQSMPDADHDRWAKPEDIAYAIVGLVSPDNRAVRGGLIPVYARA